MRDPRRSWGSARKGQLLQAHYDRLLDSRALFRQGRWAGSVYLAGYVVECLLKAAILSRGASLLVDRADRHHDLDRLLNTAGLRRSLNLPESRTVAESLSLLTNVWDVSMRYGAVAVRRDTALQVLESAEEIRKWLLERI